MYIPTAFSFDDTAEKIDFMKRYSFATIITNVNALPVASLLPFVIDEVQGKIFLRSHFSALNNQAKYIEDNVSLVVFSGPHAYISPQHYEKRESVPTWDYITVHAYGKARILHDAKAKKNALEQMISFYERDYQQQWNSLSDKFVSGMMKGIFAFELEVTALTGQKKLSQNKTNAERKNITDQLERSGDTVEKELAGYIKELS